MHPARKQKIIAVVAVVLLLAAAILLVRPLLPTQPDAGVLDERARRGLGAAGALDIDAARLPPRGDMTDEEYARHLIRLREEADRRAGDGIEPGSARGPAEGG